MATSIKLSPGLGYDVNWAESQEVFELDGPIPRLFIMKVAFGIQEWRQLRDSAINELTYDTLIKSLNAVRSQTGIDGTGNISHKVFLIRRRALNKTGNRSSLEVVKIITPNVENKLLKKVMEMERSQLVNLYSMSCVAPFTRRIAGVFYEGYCFKQIVDHGIHLNLLKMVRLSPSPGKKRRLDYDASTAEKTPRFRSSHLWMENSELEEERQKVLNQEETVVIDAKDLRVQYYYKSDGNRQLEEDTFYIPEALNEKCLDAFFTHNGYLHILQFTIAEEHFIKSLDGFFSRYTGCPPSDN